MIIYNHNITYEKWVTGIPGNKPGAVWDREDLSRELPPGKYLLENLSRELPTSGKTSPGNYLPPGQPLPGSTSGKTPEVVPGQGQLVPGVFPLPSHLFPGIAAPLKNHILVPGNLKHKLVRDLRKVLKMLWGPVHGKKSFFFSHLGKIATH